MSAPSTADATELISPTTLRVLPESGRAGAAVVVGTAVACFAAQRVAVALWVPPAQLSTVWVPGGLMLALALLTVPRRWPVVITAAAAGSTLVFLALRLVPAPASVLLGVLAGSQTVVVAGVLRAVLGPRIALATLREFLIYLGIAGVGCVVAASLLFVAGAWGARLRPATFLVWRTFALSALLGYLTTTPTVLLLVREAGTLRRVAARRRLEAILLVLLLTLASGLVFSGTVSRAMTWAAFAMTLPPLLLWAAVRFGMLGASASLLLVSVMSTLGTSRGLGPFTNVSAGDNTLSLQLFMLGTGVPLQGLAAVLSEQKRTRAALQASDLRMRAVNRELIAAREQEATRIAGELHDDVGQRLALVSIGLSRLKQARGAGIQGRGPDIAQLQEQTSSIARSLRQISHQLHPPALEHVGLAAALETTCEEVRRATGLTVRVISHGDVPAVPRDVALCLFRVTQEALGNVVRHSGARVVELSLRRTGALLLLRITDDGRGFAPGAPERTTGIGLRSAAERLRSVGGTLTIDSIPGDGTTLHVAVPLGEEDDARHPRHPG